MRKDHTDRPVIIVGCARSGTSLVAGVIHICGAWKGDTVGPSKHNAKGMFENHALRENIIKPLLFSIGADRKGQFPLPETKNIIIPHDLKEAVIKEIKKQGWKEETPWMWKCAKMALTWPCWKYAFPDSKWIIVRRKTPDIINSCMQTGFMSAYALPKVQRQAKVDNEYDGWLQWVHKHEEKFYEIVQSGANVKMVYPERMVNSDYGQMRETIEWLGLEWKSKEIMNFVEPKLWKARQNK